MHSAERINPFPTFHENSATNQILKIADFPLAILEKMVYTVEVINLHLPV